MGVIFKMYANEAPGEKFPTMQEGYLPYRGFTRHLTSLDLAPSIFALYPEYLTDAMVLVCPSDVDAGMAYEMFHHWDTGDPCVGSYLVPSHNGKPACASATDMSCGYLPIQFVGTGETRDSSS